MTWVIGLLIKLQYIAQKKSGGFYVELGFNVFYCRDNRCNLWVWRDRWICCGHSKNTFYGIYCLVRFITNRTEIATSNLNVNKISMSFLRGNMNKHNDENGKIGYLILWLMGAPVGLLLILWMILGNSLIGPG